MLKSVYAISPMLDCPPPGRWKLGRFCNIHDRGSGNILSSPPRRRHTHFVCRAGCTYNLPCVTCPSGKPRRNGRILFLEETHIWCSVIPGESRDICRLVPRSIGRCFAIGRLGVGLECSSPTGRIAHSVQFSLLGETPGFWQREMRTQKHSLFGRAPD